MKIIVLASQKGGVGKTTLAAHIAVAAEQSGDGPCVLIDTDPQASLAAWWNGREAQTPAFAPVTLKELSGKLDFDPKEHYRVQKMTFGKSGGKLDKTIITYNSHVTLTGIPLEAYDYVVNGKPALEWIMERYAVTVDKDSGIRNDPNDWSDDPRYIVNLVKRIVRVSLETMKIVNALPPLNERK